MDETLKQFKFLRWFSDQNRRRRYASRKRRNGDALRDRYLQLPETNRDEIREILEMFRPKDAGIPLIRVGHEDDGGYLVPDLLDDVTAMFSPGVSDNFDFDLEISEKGIAVFMADGSVSRPEGLRDNMFFVQSMVGPADGSGVMSFRRWVAECAPEQGDLLLQMDIEGSEYDIFADLEPEALGQFSIILLEMHDIPEMLLGPKREMLKRTLDCLLANHDICHLHPNNALAQVPIGGSRVPQLLELTLLRRDCMRGDGSEPRLPHPGDRPNVTGVPDEPLDTFWRPH